MENKKMKLVEKFVLATVVIALGALFFVDAPSTPVLIEEVSTQPVKELSTTVEANAEALSLVSQHEDDELVDSNYPVAEAVVETKIAPVPSFNEAFLMARKTLGPGQEFEWNGRLYTTNYDYEIKLEQVDLDIIVVEQPYPFEEDKSIDNSVLPLKYDDRELSENTSDKDLALNTN